MFLNQHHSYMYIDVQLTSIQRSLCYECRLLFCTLHALEVFQLVIWLYSFICRILLYFMQYGGTSSHSNNYELSFIPNICIAFFMSNINSRWHPSGRWNRGGGGGGGGGVLSYNKLFMNFIIHNISPPPPPPPTQDQG